METIRVSRRRFTALSVMVAACGLGACANAYTRELAGDQRTIEVKARRFEYSPSVITVRQGETVSIRLVSQDVTYGFHLDGYGTRAARVPMRSVGGFRS